MPKVNINGVALNYEKHGEGDPLVLIPFLSADNACYAFQLPEYSKHFECFVLDPRGAGESDKSEGVYTTELFADDIASFMDAVGIEKAHLFGVSLGAATCLKFGTKYPNKLKSLSIHSGWAKTDLYLETVIRSWQALASTYQNVAETVINAIFPCCLTPSLYASNPELVHNLSEFIKGRPAQPVEAFIRQCDAVITHDCESELSNIKAPTYITFGEYDMITSPGRFADKMKSAIENSELEIFEGCAHTPLYEKTAEFNQKSLDFLSRNV